MPDLFDAHSEMPDRRDPTWWRVLVSALTLLAATACVSPEAEFARVCRERELADGTPAMGECLEEQRAAHAAAAARRRAASARLAGPRGTGISPSGCFPSPNTGVTC